MHAPPDKAQADLEAHYLQAVEAMIAFVEARGASAGDDVVDALSLAYDKVVRPLHKGPSPLRAVYTKSALLPPFPRASPDA